MKKFFALLFSACLFISCGINDFSKKSSVSFTIPKEALQQIQQEASRSITIGEEYIDSQIKSFIEYAKESGEELSEKDIKASLQEKILYEPFRNASTIVIYSQIIGSKGTKFVSSNEISLENKVQLTDDQETYVSEMGESDFDTRGDFDVEETYGLPTEVTDEVNTDTYKNFSDLEITFNNLPTNETYTVKVDIFVERDYETSWVYTGDTNNIKLEKDKNDIVVEMFPPDAKEDNPSVFYIKDNGTILNIDKNGYRFVLKEDGTKNKEDAAQTNISYKLYYYTGTEENFETFYEDEWTEVYVVINDRFSDFEQNKIGYGYDWWNDIYLKTSFNFIPDSENEYYYPFYISILGIIDEFKTKDGPSTDYNPISKYFELLIAEDNNGYYPVLCLKEGVVSESVSISSNTGVWVRGENVYIEKGTMESSSGKISDHFTNLDSDKEKITYNVSYYFSAINDSNPYLCSSVTYNPGNGIWYSEDDPDLKIFYDSKFTPISKYFDIEMREIADGFYPVLYLNKSNIDKDFYAQNVKLYISKIEDIPVFDELLKLADAKEQKYLKLQNGDKFAISFYIDDSLFNDKHYFCSEITYHFENGDERYEPEDEGWSIPITSRRISDFFELEIIKGDDKQWIPQIKQNDNILCSGLDGKNFFATVCYMQGDYINESISNITNYTESTLQLWYTDENNKQYIDYIYFDNGVWYCQNPYNKDNNIAISKSESESVGTYTSTLEFMPPDKYNEKVVDNNSLIALIPLGKKGMNIGALTNEDTVLFHLEMPAECITYSENSLIFYTLLNSETGISNTNGEIGYIYSNCIHIDPGTTQLSIDLPINPIQLKNTVEYDTFMLHFQYVNITTSEIQDEEGNSKKGQFLTPTITYKKFEEDEKIFNVSIDGDTKRYELRIPLDSSTFSGMSAESKYPVIFSGVLKQLDLNELTDSLFAWNNETYVNMDIFQTTNNYTSLCGFDQAKGYCGTRLALTNIGKEENNRITIDTELELFAFNYKQDNELFYLQIYLPYDDSGKVLYFDEFEYGNTGAQEVLIQQD